MRALRLGVIVDSEDKLYYLKAAALESGHEVTGSVLSSNSAPNIELFVADAWIVDVSVADKDSSVAVLGNKFDEMIAGLDVPVIFCDSSELAGDLSQRDAWLRCLKLRLRRLTGDINLSREQGADSIWILAASTGGPAAVKEFLQNLPADLGVGFLYAQHIDKGYSPVLANLVNKTGAYPAVVAATGTVIARNTVTVIDPVHRVEVLENGTLLIHEERWAGPYQPCINQLAANVARALRLPAGMIVFSGMGDDGGLGGRFIKQRKGQVWAQSPDSCVIASMPEAALKSGCVDVTGTPQELAIALANFTYQQHLMIEGQHAHESSATH